MTPVMSAWPAATMIAGVPGRHEHSSHPAAPRSAVPIAYFAFAHVGLGSAFAALLLWPELPGAFFYHPRMVALVHLVTLAWLTGSILGAFYIVAPLALRLPLPAGRADWVAVASFTAGTAGMISHFWIGEYTGMAWSAGMVTAAIAWVAARAWSGLRSAPVPGGIKLHVALAFFNIIAAAVFGMVIGLDRTQGFLGLPPLAATYAHAHLAAVGWVTMMVVGLAYRLIPMMLPAVMPAGRSLGLSAILIETGLAIVVLSLLRGSAWLPLGAASIAAGLVSFVVRIRRTVGRRLPRPPALPRRDWSTWQTHAAFLWLVVALGLGVAVSIGVPEDFRAPLAWTYGVAGLVGFLAQVVVGIQGRLVPLYAWYRALAARDGAPPVRGANELPSAAFARIIFLAWTPGVPLLAWGLAAERHAMIRISAGLLLAGVLTGAAYFIHILRAAHAGRPGASTAAAPAGRAIKRGEENDVSGNSDDRSGRSARPSLAHHADRAGNRQPGAGAGHGR